MCQNKNDTASRVSAEFNIFSGKSGLCHHSITCESRKYGASLFFSRIRNLLCFPSSEKTLKLNHPEFGHQFIKTHSLHQYIDTILPSPCVCACLYGGG
jgi:hypothetical protein